ncbi:unnamed protein product, partial [Timema podura]|nr:unnamed protein product [Timema podura]
GVTTEADFGKEFMQVKALEPCYFVPIWPCHDKASDAISTILTTINKGDLIQPNITTPSRDRVPPRGGPQAASKEFTLWATKSLSRSSVRELMGGKAPPYSSHIKRLVASTFPESWSGQLHEVPSGQLRLKAVFRVIPEARRLTFSEGLTHIRERPSHTERGANSSHRWKLAKAIDIDEGENAEVSYYQVGQIQMTLTEGLENVQTPPFLVDQFTGVVQLNFDPQKGMKGYFDFLRNRERLLQGHLTYHFQVYQEYLHVRQSMEQAVERNNLVLTKVIEVNNETLKAEISHTLQEERVELNLRINDLVTTVQANSNQMNAVSKGLQKTEARLNGVFQLHHGEMNKVVTSLEGNLKELSLYSHAIKEIIDQRASLLELPCKELPVSGSKLIKMVYPRGVNLRCSSGKSFGRWNNKPRPEHACTQGDTKPAKREGSSNVMCTPRDQIRQKIWRVTTTIICMRSTNGGCVKWGVLANDSAGLQDMARVFIYLVREDQRVRFVLRQHPPEVRERIDVFRESEILMMLKKADRE